MRFFLDMKQNKTILKRFLNKTYEVAPSKTNPSLSVITRKMKFGAREHEGLISDFLKNEKRRLVRWAQREGTKGENASSLTDFFKIRCPLVSANVQDILHTQRTDQQRDRYSRCDQTDIEGKRKEERRKRERMTEGPYSGGNRDKSWTQKISSFFRDMLPMESAETDVSLWHCI